MYWSSSPSRRFGRATATSIIFWGAVILALGACGSKEDSGAIGGYRGTLLFPSEVPLLQNPDPKTAAIDCEAAQIETIEFDFNLNGELTDTYNFDCSAGLATIENVPVGSDIRLDVYAKDAAGQPLYYGFEVTTIEAGKVTSGGEIEMTAIHPGTDVARFVIEELQMEFVRISKGEFRMGSDENEPGRGSDEIQHLVRISQDFYMQTTEVTQEQWRIVAEESNDNELRQISEPSNFFDCGAKCPVEQVSWYDVERFLRALNERYGGAYGFRLPTEAEWEYAARGGADTAFANGDIENYRNMWECNPDQNLTAMGWYCDNSARMPHPVAEKDPNSYGLFDMHGNVREWCSDWYDETYGLDSETDPVVDPQGPSSADYHVIRGGSWAAWARGCRSALRGGNYPVNRGNGTGFRLVIPSTDR